MLGLTAIRTLKKPMVEKSPTLLPKEKPDRPARQVFLAPEMWRELSEAADFHTLVFKKMGVEETVSRNDLIESFLTWALDAYWDDKGGKPKTEAERSTRVAASAEKLKKLPKPSKK